MKTINNLMYFNNHINYQSILNNCVLILMQLSVFMLVLIMPNAHAEESYRFERAWPKLPQPWYFSQPQDIAIDHNGLIYIADTFNYRIQVFDENGSSIHSWGKRGHDDGEFTLVTGITIGGPKKLVYVIDGGDNRIQVFDTQGTFIRKWGSDGSGDGQFSNPTGIAVNSKGLLYVADSSNNRIQIFGSEGEFIHSWGSPGVGDGQFSRPTGITISDRGLVYVVDVVEKNNNRIQVFDAEGQFIDSWEIIGTENEIKVHGSLNAPPEIAISNKDLIYVTDTDNRQVHIYNTKGKLLQRFGSFGNADGQFIAPTGITVSARGSVYVADMDNRNNGIQVFDAEGKFIRSWKSSGTGNGKFNFPQGIAINASGDVFVADSINHRIQVFNAEGKFTRDFGSFGSGNGEFKFPHEIAINASGSVYVADTINHRVQVFNTEGEFVLRFGGVGSENGEFKFPKGIAVSASGFVYVADTLNHRVQLFNKNGEYLYQWGGFGSGDGEFNQPKGIVISANGDVYVADSQNHRIQVFDASGAFLRSFGSHGLGDGQFFEPKGIVVPPNGLVYVTDCKNNNQIQVFNELGDFVESIISRGSDYGQTVCPGAIEFNSDGALFVADTGNDRIQKFVRGKPTISKHPYKAIILAGGGPPTESYRNLIWTETQLLTNKAHQALRSQGFDKDEVKFLTAGNTITDLDGNGLFDDFVPATLDSLRQAITQWAIDADDVVIYLADHGGPGRFQINDREILNETQLTQWVEQLDALIPGKVTLIIEACKSASFLSPLAADQRYLIASADANQAAIISNEGLNSFSYFFWGEIGSGADLQSAFKIGRQGMSSQLIEGRPQNAQLDSNGDQRFNSTDYTTLASFCLGNCTTYGANPPTIESAITIPSLLNGKTASTLSIQVNSLEPIFKAWAVIVPPDFQHTDSNEPVSELPQTLLQCDQKQVCSTIANTFDTKGDYQITYYVQDTKNQLAIPDTIMLTQTEGKDNGTNYLETSGHQGVANINLDWKTITAPAVYNNPVVIAGPPSFKEADPGVVRIKNINSTGANVQYAVKFQEWDYKTDGFHAPETIPYLIVDAGRYTMTDSSVWEVGSYSQGGTGSFETIRFNQEFTSQPELFLTVQTTNGGQAVTVRAKNVTANGFKSALYEQESLMDGHASETIGYLAIHSPTGNGTVSLGGQTLSYHVSRAVVSHQWTPVLNRKLISQEEQSKDKEVRHATETLSILGLGQLLFAQDISTRGGDPMALRQK